MPTVDAIIDYLAEHDVLGFTGEDPFARPGMWPAPTGDERAVRVDWDNLFPHHDRDSTFLPGDLIQPALMADIEGAIDADPPNDPREEGEAAGGAFDVQAWYAPIHYFGDAWGIYIRQQAIYDTMFYIARFVRRSEVGHGTDAAMRCARAAFAVYFLHEHYHHKTESLGLRLHVVAEIEKYRPYMEQVYFQHRDSDDCLEEALANAYAYRRLAEAPYGDSIGAEVRRATRSYLKWRFPKDPPGYRLAPRYLRTDDFKNGENVFKSQLFDASLTPARSPSDWELAPRLSQTFFTVASDIWLVFPEQQRPIVPTQQVMHLSTAEVGGVLRRHGWKLDPGAGKGSHELWKKPGAPRPVPVPKAKDISIGTLGSIKRALGLPSVEALRKEAKG